MKAKYNIITILGATASGKTNVATQLAYELNTEIISADSRQVYRNMDIGTGKDLNEYIVNNQQIPYHLIDILDAGSKYNVYEFQRDFFAAYKSIKSKGKLPILCGGTGLYIESVLQNYHLPNVNENTVLREKLADKSLDELEIILRTYKSLNNNSDFDTAKRAIRAIEIADYAKHNYINHSDSEKINSLTIGILYEREERRQRITTRLKQRLENGMIQEVEKLVENGVLYSDLEYYGLEYKYVAYYLQNKISYTELFEQLEVAIHQFAKRQMTWFRKMERSGNKIHWLDGNLSLEEKIDSIKMLLV